MHLRQPVFKLVALTNYCLTNYFIGCFDQLFLAVLTNEYLVNLTNYFIGENDHFKPVISHASKQPILFGHFNQFQCVKMTKFKLVKSFEITKMINPEFVKKLNQKMLGKCYIK